MDEMERPIEEYKSFNDFFARKLKPGCRPIDSPSDPSVLVSPADSRIVVYPTIELSYKYWLKGHQFTIEELLGEELAHMAPRYEKGAVLVSRLAPNDYHRWHMPIDCHHGQRVAVPGQYYSVSPRAVREVNIFGQNKREACVLHSDSFGTVVMIAVGAAMVAGITILAEEGQDCKKGDEHGYFTMGGSTLVLLFEPGKVCFDEDLIASSQEPIETYVKMGNRIGTSTVETSSSDSSSKQASSTGYVRKRSA